MSKFDKVRKLVSIIESEDSYYRDFDNELKLLFDFITSCEETENRACKLQHDLDKMRFNYLELVKDVKRFNELTVIKNYKYGNGLTINDYIEFINLKYKLSKILFLNYNFIVLLFCLNLCILWGTNHFNQRS